jgi:dolichol kinase
MAAISRPATVVVLMAGTLLYAWLETLRLSGVKVPLVSSITSIASRSRDKGRVVLGPVTLGLGALLALLLYPSPAATIAIYALAFGDGFASLVGKFFGTHRPSIMLGKSIEGSMACFIAVFIAAVKVSGGEPQLLASAGGTGSIKIALAAAITATLVEVLPLEDYDNLALPMAVGFAVQAFL